MIYPWLADTLADLVDRNRRDRLPHALLFVGQSGLGKLHLAETLMQQLMCEASNGCGVCKFCHLLAAGSHPDYKLIQPEEDSRQIKIEQIRQLNDWVNQTAQMGAHKIAILNPAHAMNRNSANALLKAMEEPPQNTHLFLVSDDPAILLPTVRSRCQQVKVPTPDRQLAVDWLQGQGKGDIDWELLLRLGNGSPLHAINKFDDAFLARRQEISAVWCDLLTERAEVVGLVDKLGKLDPIEVIELGMTLFADVARHHLAAGEDAMHNSDLRTQITEIAGHIQSQQALALVSRLQTDYRLLKGSQNPNKTLLLEHLMIDCQNMETQSFSL
ncbi:MAG: DNA polymerase-3 subunit delta' [Sulfitobacter sp.]